MRIRSSYFGAAPYSTDGKYVLNTDQDRQKKEENSLVSAAAGKIAGKMKTSQTFAANDTILSEQSAFIASLAQQTSDNDLAVAAEIARLRQKEREVIAHEAAHKAAGGQYASAVRYTYTTGPDGKKYIDGGDVSIRIPSANNPEEALRLAELVKRAALAPANLSIQDMAVAASATQKVIRARAGIARLVLEEATKQQDENSQTTEARKTGAINLPGVDLARSKKAVDAYASLSDIDPYFSSSGQIYAMG